MQNVRIDRADVAVAVGCGLAAAVFLWSHGTAGLVLAAVVPLVVVAYRRRPLLAVAGVTGLMVAHDVLLGIPTENPALLGAFVVVLYGLGRYGSRLAGALGFLAMLPLAIAPSETRVGNMVFFGLLYTALWTFGFLVGRRTEAAETAASEAWELASLDPVAATERAVAEERARLAGDTLAVVRSAVEAMRGHADAAGPDLDPRALTAIQEEGRRATRELRRLLGLLRSEPEPGDRTEATGRAQRRRWRGDLLALGAVTVLLAIDIPYALGAGDADLSGVILAAALAVTVLLRRVDPAIACLAATAPLVVALALNVAIPYGAWVGAAGMILVWSVVGRTAVRVHDYAAVGLFAGALLLDTYRHQPGNVPMAVALLGVAFVAGHLWGRAGRSEESATQLATTLRATHDSWAEQAIRTERLRLARELHDVASHSVGVMVLQAGAAAALRDTAPDRAREALGNVRSAASQACAELDVLYGLLDAGAVGLAGHASSRGHADLTADLAALAARMRHAGLRVSLDVTPAMLLEPTVGRTTYRVVQEALTNAVRHAPGSAVAVAVRRDGGALTVTVRDDGATSGEAPATTGGGFGLVGLDERVRAHGGELTAGPMPGGGFEVKARIPVAEDAEVPA